ADASADGTFTVTVSSGAYRVSATATGYTASTPVEVRLTEREPTELQIALERGATISGRITDESGAPIAEADIYVFGAELDRMSKRSGPRVAPGNTRSAQDGTFSVSGVEPGTASMTVRKEGFVPFRKAIEASTSTNVDVQLSRGLTIEGVVMRNGKPAAEVSVSASTAAVGGDHQPAVTDANGRFVLRGLIAARYTVTAFREDVHTEVRDVDPTKEQELVISLDPKPAGVIYGTVTGIPQTLGGKIVRRAVFVQSDEQGTEGLIDENGNYRIENAPTGNVFVTAQLESTAGGRTSPRKSVNVVAGQQTRVDLDLGGGISVTGRVSYEGRAVPAVRVVFMNAAGVGASGTTRTDGAYEVTLADAGLYQIFAHGETGAMRHFQTVREVRGGETIDIDVREQSIEGTVVDAETRQPIVGAIVSLAPDANVMESVAGESITMQNGRFQILTAAAGPHRVVASAPGYAHRAQPVALGARAIQQFAFELQRVPELRVRVYDAKSGTALEAHIVVATLEGAYVPVRAQRSADGEWFVMSLAAGKYRITSIVHGYPQKVVEVTAPGSVEIGM
ncbi:MAG TPA: carboxypeptidase regulatory-like domain-containing protein, partial [Thermoanaerobaculia bacterium]|nr:carboxypeptidase regulatory-like domain-containing protein [Thermoanaerobaculia bacterium]